MAIRLIVSDLDGCLLHGDGSLPGRFAEAMERMREAGVTFAAASGRSLAGTLRPLGPWADGMALITDNGSRAFVGGRPVLERTISPEDRHPVLEELRRTRDVFAIACGVSAEWSEPMRPLTPEMERELKKHYPVRRECDLDLVPEGVVKLTLLYPGDIERDVYPYLERFDNERIRVQVTAPVWIDVYAKGTSKGAGVEALQRELGISPEETAVFGDYLNDISMAERAARSFAPANAHPEVRAAFTDVIGPNEDESVAKTILSLLAEG